jgi:ribosomal protein S18 acetylase RimI-like enzyme
MSMTELEDRAHANLVEFVRFLGRLDGNAAVLDEPGIFAIRGGVDFPSTRIVIRQGGAQLAPSEFADRASDFLFEGGKTACAYVRTDDRALHDEMTGRGFVEYSTSPEMVCETRLEARPLPDGVQLRRAETPADIAAYAAIAGHAFRHLQFPEDITRAAVDNPDVMLEPGVAVALADLDGRPVAGACSLLVGDEPNGYVGWVACHDDARGRGLGDVVTRAVTNAAFDRGAQIVTLEASHFGEHTYARMGYRELYRYGVLVKL